MTSPTIDAAGSGWLRLTGNTNSATGTALFTGGRFSARAGVTLSFNYVAWGGGVPGADGIALFLYDASGDMTGGLGGGALGYCKGNGGWLGLGLDAFGNFSNPEAGCGGGPGNRPQSLVLRGPTAAGNPFHSIAAIPGGVDHPGAQTRPAPAQLVLHLVPKVAGTGFTVTVDWRARAADAFTRLLDRADFPHAAPEALRLGVAGTTGGARNIHEVRNLSVQVHQPPNVRHSFDPPEVAKGRKSTWVLELGGSAGGVAILTEPFTHKLGPNVRVAQPLALGGTCPGAVLAVPGSDAVTIDRGSVIRPGGCTVTVQVVVTAPGSFASTVSAGTLVTDKGLNLQPSTATVMAR